MRKTKREIQSLIFDIGTIIEVVTVFIYFFFRKDIIVFIGLPVAVLLMFIGKFHKKTLKEKKLEEIELHDERNIIIRDKAQSKANLFMVYLGLAIIIVLAFMGEYNATLYVSIAVMADSLLSRYLTYYYNKRL